MGVRGVAGAILRTGENDQDYRLGNARYGQARASYAVARAFQPNVTYNYAFIDALNGADKTFGRNAFMDYYHSEQENWDISLGVSGEVALMEKSALALGYELALPVQQQMRNVANVGLEKNFEANMGLKAAF